MADATPTLAQLVSQPLQAECLIHYLRDERGEGFDVEAIVALHVARQITLDDLRKEEFRRIWVEYISSRKIPLSPALEQEIQAKMAQVESNPLGHQDIFYRFEQEVIPRLQALFSKFLESQLWKDYLKATDSEIFKKLKLTTELNNFPPLPFPSRNALRVARYTLTNALDLVRTIKANLLSDGKKKKIDVKFCLQTKTYNLMCQGATELRKVSLANLSSQERLVFFLNLYNTMVVHGHLAYEYCPIEKDDFLQKIKYNVAGHVFSLDDIRRGILGAKGPRKMFHQGDPRSQFLVDFDPRIGFFLAPLNRSCACTRVFTLEHLDSDINSAVAKFINTTISVSDQQIILPKVFKDLKKDLGGKKEMLNFACQYLSEDLKTKVQSKPKWKISYASHHDHHPEFCWIEYDIDDLKNALPQTRSSGRKIFSFGSPKEKRSQSPPTKKTKKLGTSPKAPKAATSPSPTSTTTTTTTTSSTSSSSSSSSSAPPAAEATDPASLEKRLLSKFNDDVLKMRVIGNAGNEVVRVTGPHDQSNGGEVHHGHHVSARVISTYPHVPTKALRDGDPICDRISILGYENRCIVTMTDGCNWGAKARDASLRANEAFTQYVEEHINELTDLHQISIVFLKAVLIAHESIMNTKASEIGTTTILGGILCELDPTSIVALSSSSSTPTFADKTEGKKWGFFCISVGDCKAYHYSVRTQTIVDITKGNRRNLLDARDPGGRLGPYNDAGTPDLRNLAIYFRVVEADDLVIVVSDGVHDNFDPQLMGVNPREMGLEADSWVNAAADLVEDKKYQYSTHMMSEILRTLPKSPDGKISARKVTDLLIDHANSVTSASRDFMVNFPKKKLPIDYKTYPGKMDHTSCICIRVGDLPTLLDDPETPPSSPKRINRKSFIKLTSASGKITPPNLSNINNPNLELPTMQILPELAVVTNGLEKQQLMDTTEVH